MGNLAEFVQMLVQRRHSRHRPPCRVNRSDLADHIVRQWRRVLVFGMGVQSHQHSRSTQPSGLERRKTAQASH
ncbi:hypothetical protein [Aquabacterium sp.]|uniref:hypothetical protein n=1 Tax=Aquabacterium sp. TaxID=1872578 RepID=UPI002488289F|nr:hypothetical protein [Aquabacterium sp.]MDI1348681.1 hypothetical protein [Aquabacterium sp.]